MKIFDLCPHLVAMRFEDCLPLPHGVITLRSQSGVAQHIPDWHPGRFQATEKSDPDENRRVVIASGRAVAIGIGQQADPLVIADGISRKARTPSKFTDLHEYLFVTTLGKLRVGAHSKSMVFFHKSNREEATIDGKHGTGDHPAVVRKQ